jgi:hypothetical protein
MAIISHKHKFIFLKTRKTASGSLEVALAGICGHQDCLCPTGDGKELGIVELNNRKSFSQVKSRDLANFCASSFKNLRKGKPEFSRTWHKMFRIIKGTHFDAENMKRACGPEVWNSYYKFCFERNPFDRLVSFYHWRTKKFDNPPTFREFALAAVQGNRKDQSRLRATNFSNRPFYEINGKIVVDKVYRFENLEDEINDFFAMKGISWNGNLLHTKGSYRPKKNYQEYYDPELLDLCEKAFSFELENFGYKF